MYCISPQSVAICRLPLGINTVKQDFLKEWETWCFVAMEIERMIEREQGEMESEGSRGGRVPSIAWARFVNCLVYGTKELFTGNVLYYTSTLAVHIHERCTAPPHCRITSALTPIITTCKYCQSHSSTQNCPHEQCLQSQISITPALCFVSVVTERKSGKKERKREGMSSDVCSRITTYSGLCVSAWQVFQKTSHLKCKSHGKPTAFWLEN